MYTNHKLEKHNLIENEKVLLVYRKTAQSKHSRKPSSHERSLYDVDSLNHFPDQNNGPIKIGRTDGRTKGQQVIYQKRIFNLKI